MRRAVVLRVTPVGAPRMTRADAWKKRPAVLRYREFADRLREEAARAGFAPTNGMEVCFRIPMPASWSKRKKLAHENQPHTTRPDLDNLTKALLDPLLAEDSGIWYLGRLQKRWAAEGAIVVILPDTGGER